MPSEPSIASDIASVLASEPIALFCSKASDIRSHSSARARKKKRKSRTAYLEHDQLVTGHYKSCENDLSIYRERTKTVDIPETEYGFVKPRRLSNIPAIQAG
ncbi:hypothetical protein [Sphingopyxis sp. L1A2A]|uniref:hypothetical protein n=1 Tax=Sphingopyxis sp. L1A2A TaxID=2502247 RepID=UPI0014857F0D|nr:hypothetical protein [Sphingopyxis sp. L1A2A]